MGKTSGPAAKVTLQPPREQQPRHRTAASAANPVREPGGRPGNLRGDAVSPGDGRPRAMGGTGHPDVPRSRGCAAGLCGQRGQSSARLCAARPQPLHLSGDPRAGTAPSPARTQPATRHREPRGSRVGPRRAPRCNRHKALPRLGPGAPGPADKAPRPGAAAPPGREPPARNAPAPPRAAPRPPVPVPMRCGAGPYLATRRGARRGLPARSMLLPVAAAPRARREGRRRRDRPTALKRQRRRRPGPARRQRDPLGTPRPIEMGLGSHPPADTASPNRGPRPCGAPQ